MSPAARAAPLGIRVTTYAELEKIVHAFAAGHFQLLILLGSHGLGKSRMVRQALPGPSCWLEGNTSVFGLYCQLWHHRHQPVLRHACEEAGVTGVPMFVIGSQSLTGLQARETLVTPG